MMVRGHPYGLRKGQVKMKARDHIGCQELRTVDRHQRVTQSKPSMNRGLTKHSGMEHSRHHWVDDR